MIRVKDNRKVIQFDTTINNFDSAPSYFDESSHDEMEKELKELVAQAENYDFLKLCSLDDSGWDLHQEERRLAEEIYTLVMPQTFNVRGANKVHRTENGKGNIYKIIKYPRPDLDTGPF